MSPPGSQRFGKIAVPATVAAGAGGQFVLKLCYPNRTRPLPRAPLRQMRRRFPRRAALRLPLLRGKGGVMASDIMLAVGDGAPKGQRKSPIGQTLGHPIRCPLGQTR